MFGTPSENGLERPECPATSMAEFRFSQFPSPSCIRASRCRLEPAVRSNRWHRLSYHRVSKDETQARYDRTRPQRPHHERCIRYGSYDCSMDSRARPPDAPVARQTESEFLPDLSFRSIDF